MAKFIVQGGTPLHGSITPVGNKNAALPMVAACLLTEHPVTLRNVPDIRDVRVLMDLLQGLGASIQHDPDDRSIVTIHAAEIPHGRPDAELCRRVRGSILLAGPLLNRVGHVQLAPPGGDVIGRRRVDTHIHGFQALGVTTDLTDGYTLNAPTGGLRGTDILLDEASVTATENLVMAAVLASGETTLYNVACEPHVQNLCHMLVAMGARIDGIGTNFLRIHGAAELTGCDIAIDPDFMEAGSLLVAAAATGGSLTLNGMAPTSDTDTTLPVMRRGFEKLGLRWTTDTAVDGGAWHLPPNLDLTVATDIGGAVAKLEDGPWPAFPSDLMSVAIVLATQATGGILFFEKMFESRLYFVDRLIEMGARIVQCDPHRVMVLGPCPLRGCLLTSPDIRAGMALVIAALCAEGESIIDNAQMIDRGYQRIEERLRSLGAQIERIDD